MENTKFKVKFLYTKERKDCLNNDGHLITSDKENPLILFNGNGRPEPIYYFLRNKGNEYEVLAHRKNVFLFYAILEYQGQHFLPKSVEKVIRESLAKNHIFNENLFKSTTDLQIKILKGGSETEMLDFLAQNKEAFYTYKKAFVEGIEDKDQKREFGFICA